MFIAALPVSPHSGVRTEINGPIRNTDRDYELEAMKAQVKEGPEP